MNCSNFNFLQPAFILFLLINFSSYAQTTGQLVLQHLTEENGLSDNHVQCIYKDRKNFVWAGTLSGLNVIDGSDITLYKHNAEDSTSISNNNILSITGDSNGLIWVGTELGLNSFNPLTKKFTQYDLPANMLGKTQYITCVAADKKGHIFIGTPYGLFYYANKKIRSVIIQENKNDLAKNNRINCLIVDHSGLLWITTFNGLWTFDVSNNKITHEISLVNDPDFSELFTTIIEDHENNIWIGSWERGLKKYDPITKQISEIDTTGRPRNITSLAETEQPDGNYLIWMNGSLAAFDPTQNRFIHFPVPYNIRPPVNITKVYASADNWLWMCSNEGLYIYNPLKTLFRHHLFSSPITSQDVSLQEWNKRLLVSGAGENFLKEYDQQLRITDDYSKDEATKKLSCLAIKLAGNSVLKAATNNGIADINLNTHKVDMHPLDFLAKDFEAGNFITNIFEDQNKTWWIFPWRNGIWSTDSTYHNFHRVFNNFINEGRKPKSVVIADALEDKNGNLWFTDLDEGIIFYNRSSNKFSKPFKNKLGERYTTSQLLYYNNNCYSFLNTEILMWNCDSMALHVIGLPAQMDKQIISMAIDSSGEIWLATRQGLIVYNAISKTFDRFTTSDGLVKNDMDGSLICLSGGTIVFGGPEYLTAFEPVKLLQSIRNTPEILLTDVIADQKNIFFNAAKRMKFNYSVNNFIFKWTITDYNDPLNNNYYYKLQGIDTIWRYVGHRGEIEFANLSPGDYTLVLKGANSNHVYAKNDITIHFEIKPPFWVTGWFLGLCAITILSIFYAFYRYRLNQVLKLQNLRNKISLDLHDDIGSTLSSISILSEMAMHQKKESTTIDMLREIKENSISLMERMDDIVWSINPKNDSLESLFLRTKIFAAKLFEAKEINYKIHISEKLTHVLLPMEYRQHIYLIMKEAINNLVKYSSCTEAEIDVRFHLSQLTILIKDNGKGFNVENSIAGNGLNSMEKRAGEMNASFDILSTRGEGTSVILVVKIK
jgi:ligand-binding sensor domain-containing protein/two-component sensor histidine kinase